MIASWPLALLFAGAALWSAIELLRAAQAPRTYLSDREAHGVHVVMNGAMAVMFVPGLHGHADGILIALLALTALFLGVRLGLALRSGRAERVGSAGYHLIGVAAMLYAMGAMAHGAAMDGHGMAHAMPVAPDAAGPGLAAWALGVLFIADALATGVMVWGFPRRLLSHAGEAVDSVRDGAAAVRALRLSAVPHVMMDLGMAAMLLV